MFASKRLLYNTRQLYRFNKVSTNWKRCSFATASKDVEEVSKFKRYSFDRTKFTAEELKRWTDSFNKLDKDNDGALNFQEFRTAVEKDDTTDYATARKMFSQYDIDKNGVISMDEFFQMIDEIRSTQSKQFHDSFASHFRDRLLNTLKDKEELDIVDPQVLFDTAWTNILNRHGEEQMRFPKELIWLGGSPGAGKGTNTPYITKARGLTAPPIIMSELLDEFPEIKASGKLVSDLVVTELIMEKLLEPRYRNGVICDGYPRTEIQVHCLHLLRKKMSELRQKYSSTLIGRQFPRPRFIVAILFVDEAESVRRQLLRGELARQHNLKVAETGIGELLPVRETDVDDAVAHNRYRVFLQHYKTIQKLKDYFTFTVINAMGTIEEVQRRIQLEFAYQSGNELSQAAFETICDIPTMAESRGNARQLLCARLEEYVTQNKDLFSRVVAYVSTHFVPLIQDNVIGGECWVKADASLFADVTARQMAIDLMSERGYWILWREDLSSAEFMVFRVRWPPVVIREEPKND